MSNKITLKKSSIGDKVPAAGDLDYGELALNYTDGNLFYKNSSNAVTTIASNKFVSVTGNVTGNYIIGDGSQLTNVQVTSVAGVYVLADVASDYGSAYQAKFISNFVAQGSSTVVPVSVTSTNTLMAEFATNPGFPNQALIPAGIFNARIKAQKSAGASAYVMFAEFWRIHNGVADTLIATTNQSSATSDNTLQTITTNAVLAATTTWDTEDRLLIRWYARIVSGATSTISISFDATTGAGFDLPAPAPTINEFVPYDNALWDVDLGSHNLTANVISAAGNVTGNYFIGNGSQLTGVTAPISGNLSGNLQGNGFGANALSFVSATGNVVGTNFFASGVFYGDGSGLTGITTTGGYFNSTLTAFPTGNYGDGEPYVEEGTTQDSFGVTIVPNFSCMDPQGSIPPATDLGAL